MMPLLVTSVAAPPLLVSIRDAAAVLSVSEKFAYNLAASGALDKKYIGKGTRNFRITYASLERYVDSLQADPVSA